jgi:hypothetical protein
MIRKIHPAIRVTRRSSLASSELVRGRYTHSPPSPSMPASVLNGTRHLEWSVSPTGPGRLATLVSIFSHEPKPLAQARRNVGGVHARELNAKAQPRVYVVCFLRQRSGGHRVLFFGKHFYRLRNP